MGSNEYLIETEDLTKNFGDFTAVDSLNLKIKENEIFGFLGPNGAGKTTSIRMMVGLLSPTEGKVKIEGDATGEPNERVGICPQNLVIWKELTSYENIYFMGKMYDVPSDELEQRVESILEDLKLTEKRNSPASELSGGMKRRLNLGMSIVHEPDLVVLDEPTAGLDPQSRHSVWDYIRNLKEEQGRCIILTTHLMEEADRLSDRVAIIDRGKLLVVDTPEDLKKSVGKGDSISLELEDKGQNQEVLDMLRNMDEVIEANEIDENLVLRVMDAVGRMADLTEKIEGNGFEISDVSISRTNTLEDVFIHLTGRRLES
ncbi:ABC transporter ATP-binding protein [Candidatus Bipolaricaulota bacterium]|nr:ABC transporter ATP-binding protein [Candidatus Bipolaricaulota bacterium]